MPEVSVIIPCYNHAHYLSYAVRSVLGQTYIDWEAIIVDDGSIDDTRNVAAQFTDPRIQYIYQTNQGLSAARNTGIRVAQGEYLAFLDADDEWEPRFLEACVEALAEQKPITAVVTLARLIDENSAELPRLGGQVIRPEAFHARLVEGGFFPPNAALVRAEVVRREGLFDETLTSVEDWDLWLRITGNGGVMLTIPEPLARYRVSTGSMSTNTARMHANRMAVLAKHFGPPVGNPLAWSIDKRHGYAFACRITALGYIAQQDADEGWRFMRRAVETDPFLLERLDTFYELALGDQPRGYRGEARLLSIAANGEEMLRRLDALLASACSPVQALRGAAFGNAYLALAMLSDQAGDWASARRYLYRAIQAKPALLRDLSVVRRFTKLLLGQRVIRSARRLWPRSVGASGT